MFGCVENDSFQMLLLENVKVRFQTEPSIVAFWALCNAPRNLKLSYV